MDFFTFYTGTLVIAMPTLAILCVVVLAVSIKFLLTGIKAMNLYIKNNQIREEEK